MDQKPVNPLSKHFRQPAIYMKLPSEGKFWPDGTLELPASGEIPVYPMTARDEITIRTPDALLNGQGVVDVIHSCCPNIKDAWKMPSVDADAVLLNIRIASYGNQMDFDTVCPHCQTENNFALDLGILTGNLACPDYNTLLDVDGLKIKIKPQTYYDVNYANQIAFTEQQILRTVNDDNISDDEKKITTDAYLSRLIDLNIQICANSTDSITTEDGVAVTDAGFIKEFYNQADFKVMRKIQDRLKELGAQAELKPIDHNCPECTKEYTVPLTFDYANFFA
jgi:hypothetical protein